MFYYKLKIIYLTYWLLFFYKTNENYNNILQYKEIKIILIRTRKKNDALLRYCMVESSMR